MVVFALILLFFANHQSPVDPVRHLRHRAPRGRQLLRGVPRRHVHGAVRRLRVRHGRHVRRGDGRRQPAGAARRPVVDLAVRPRRGDLPAGGDAVVPGHRCRGGDGPGVRVPDRRHDHAEPDLRRSSAIHARRAVPRRDPHRGLRVHAGDPGRDRPADVLDGPRPAPAARRGVGPRQPDVPDPGLRVDRGRRPRRPPAPRDGRGRLDLPRHRGDRDDLHRLLPVQPGRPASPVAAAGRRRPRSSASGAGAR